MRGFVVAALLGLAACERPPAPPPATPPPPEFPPLPELKTSDDFSKDEFIQLPDAPAEFLWDLREDVHHYYAFTQESNLVVSASGGGQTGRLASRTQWKGDGEIIGGGSGRGELAFLSSPIAQWNNNQPLSSEELNKVKKIVIRYQLNEDGIATRQLLSGEEDPLLDLYLALPPREFKPGKNSERDVHLSLIRDHLQYHGRQEFTWAGRRKVGRHECVKVLSRVDVEATPPGDGKGRMVGWIANYFDPKERRIVRVDAALVMAVDVRRETRPADPQAPAFWQLNRVQADMRVTITLKD